MFRDLPIADQEDVRRAAEILYRTGAGRLFVDQLLEDLQLYDIPSTPEQQTLHSFGLWLIQSYFGRMTADRDHRSLITEAILSVQPPDDRLQGGNTHG